MLTLLKNGFRQALLISDVRIESFSNEQSAAAFLEELTADLSMLEAVKEAMLEAQPYASIGELSNDQLIRQASELLANGTLCVVRPRPRFSGPQVELEQKPKEKPKPKEKQTQAEKPKQPKYEPVEQSTVDPKAQADTLKRAAKNGTPICEECQKASYKLEASKPEKESTFEPASQAITLKDAAKEGIPFCEECHKSR